MLCRWELVWTDATTAVDTADKISVATTFCATTPLATADTNSVEAHVGGYVVYTIS